MDNENKVGAFLVGIVAMVAVIGLIVTITPGMGSSSEEAIAGQAVRFEKLAEDVSVGEKVDSGMDSVIDKSKFENSKKGIIGMFGMENEDAPEFPDFDDILDSGEGYQTCAVQYAQNVQKCETEGENFLASCYAYVYQYESTGQITEDEAFTAQQGCYEYAQDTTAACKEEAETIRQRCVERVIASYD